MDLNASRGRKTSALGPSVCVREARNECVCKKGIDGIVAYCNVSEVRFLYNLLFILTSNVFIKFEKKYILFNIHEGA